MPTPTSESRARPSSSAAPPDVRIALEILAYSCAAGLFVVPIFAAVQAWAGEDRRARVIGAVNTLNSIYMVGGSLATTLLLKLAGLGESTALVVLGVANFAAAIYFFRRLPAEFSRLRAADAVAGLFSARSRRRSTTCPPPASRNIVAVNHVSLARRADHPVAARRRADLGRSIAASRGAGGCGQFLKLCDARPLDPTKPLAARELVTKAREGRRLVIFPEGRSTVTGSLTKVFVGAAMIADKSRRDDHAGQDRRPRPLAALAPAHGAGPPQSGFPRRR